MLDFAEKQLNQTSEMTDSSLTIDEPENQGFVDYRPKAISQRKEKHTDSPNTVTGSKRKVIQKKIGWEIETRIPIRRPPNKQYPGNKKIGRSLAIDGLSWDIDKESVPNYGAALEFVTDGYDENDNRISRIGNAMSQWINTYKRRYATGTDTFKLGDRRVGIKDTNPGWEHMIAGRTDRRLAETGHFQMTAGVNPSRIHNYFRLLEANSNKPNQVNPAFTLGQNHQSGRAQVTSQDRQIIYQLLSNAIPAANRSQGVLNYLQYISIYIGSLVQAPQPPMLTKNWFAGLPKTRPQELYALLAPNERLTIENNCNALRGSLSHIEDLPIFGDPPMTNLGALIDVLLNGGVGFDLQVLVGGAGEIALSPVQPEIGGAVQGPAIEWRNIFTNAQPREQWQTIINALTQAVRVINNP